MGRIEWDKTLKALVDINYDGDFTFEADNCLNRFPDELIPDALKFLHSIGRNMIGQIENYKNK